MPESPRRWEKLNAFSSFATAICTFLLVITGLGALRFAYDQIQESRAESRVQHLVEFMNRFEHPPVSDAMKSLARQRMDAKQEKLKDFDPADPPDALTDVLDFFEDIGLLANKGYLDKRMVWNTFGESMFVVYTDTRPFIDDQQQQQKASWNNFTSLMEDMRDIDKQEENGAGDHPSQDEILGYYQAVAESQPGEPPPRRRMSSRSR